MDVGNYIPISVFTCFSIMLEKMLYNHVYKHVNENNLLYRKQFGFQKAHSTKYAVI